MAAVEAKPTFENLYAEYFAYVYRTVARHGVPRRHYDDAVHDVFLIVHLRLPSYEPRGRLKAWLAVIAWRVASKYRNDNYWEPLVTNGDDPEPMARVAAAPLDPEHEAGARECVVRLLNAIEPERRIVLIMHDLDEIDIPTIASVLNISKGTADNRLRLARRDYKAAWLRLDAQERYALTRGGGALGLLLSADALLQWERVLPSVPKEVQDRVWARLQASTVGHPPDSAGPPDATAPAQHPGTHFLLRRALPYVLGFATAVATDHPGRGRVEPAVPPIPPDVAAIVAPAVTAMSLGTVVPPIVVSPGPLMAVSAHASPTSVPSAPLAPTSKPTRATVQSMANITNEHVLMQRARAALRSGDLDGALAAVHEHGQRYPDNGWLAEERTELEIAALLRAGRTAEARAVVGSFARTSPGSPRLADFSRTVEAPSLDRPLP